MLGGGVVVVVVVVVVVETALSSLEAEGTLLLGEPDGQGFYC